MLASLHVNVRVNAHDKYNTIGSACELLTLASFHNIPNFSTFRHFYDYVFDHLGHLTH